MKLGAMIYLSDKTTDGELFKPLMDYGLPTCQLAAYQEEQFTDKFIEDVKKSQNRYGIQITALWSFWYPPAVWDFYEGPSTLGLVPQAFRFARLQFLKQAATFAGKLGIRDFITHVGFIPENPNDPEYTSLIPVLRDLVNHCEKHNQNFLFETGQETPITLRRVIEDINLKNVGINLDPANLLLYGKANPIDALDIIGEYVKGVHAKDGEYPTNPRSLGEEKKLGEGRVNFPGLIKKLKEIGYEGAITIEREISGEQQVKDIIEAKNYLLGLIE